MHFLMWKVNTANNRSKRGGGGGARESFMIPIVDGEVTSVIVNVKDSEFSTALT